jgi:hypothetical protein
MARGRVSQHGVEVFYSPADRALVSQHGVEVFYIEAADAEPGGGTAAGVRVFGYAG